MSKLERAVIRHQIEEVTFGFYTDEEVRNRSVVQITSPQAYDAIGTPLPRGLYDPRLGPPDQDGGSCVTCGNPYIHCPGHCGHIELSVPVYHILNFPTLIKFLRGKCLNCHNFRMARRHSLTCLAKLHLIDEGFFNLALSLDDDLARAYSEEGRGRIGGGGGGGGGGRSGSGGVASAEEVDLAIPTDDLLLGDGGDDRDDGPPGGADVPVAAERLLRDRLATKRRDPSKPYYVTSHERAHRRSIVKEFLTTTMAEKKCRNCSAFSPKIRQDSNNKVFLGRLAEKNRRVNAAEGVRIRPAVTALRQRERLAGGEGGGGGGGDGKGHGGGGGGGGGDGDEGGWESNESDAEAEEAVDDEGADADASAAAAAAAGVDGPAAEPAGKDRFMHALEVEAQVRMTWMQESDLCLRVFGGGLDVEVGDGWKIFFLRAVCVPPSRFRPPMAVGTIVAEHSQNHYLSRILQLNERIREHFAVIQARSEVPDAVVSGGGGGGGGTIEERLADAAAALDAERDRAQSMLFERWIELQTTVNCFMDSSKDPDINVSKANVGIRQILEKKEGIFRKHMMGKRVDFACRSVISPDPYIGTNEIGIPVVFAKKLTYPTPVTANNVVEMRGLVERGPDNYPGAVWVEEANGQRYDLTRMDDESRQALAARLLTGRGQMKVGRQLQNGDMMLMNRQPTLHKPGIMAHDVRVLHDPEQKTVRMHYANCNTYNADYDGDEMNGHFPQGDIARAEARCIMATDLQYIVPTDGSPLRGLIQDHVDGGVKMCNKDTFFERSEYQQLLFATLSSLSGLEVIGLDMDIEMVPPAIRKPRELWTGKQVITTLLQHLRRGNDEDNWSDDEVLPGISVEQKAKTPSIAFGEAQGEHLVLVRDGELLRGVLDKAAFGASEFSLVHAVFEAYGPTKAGLLLNCFGRLFTAYIQYYSGHSCRMEDLVLTKEADAARREVVQVRLVMPLYWTVVGVLLSVGDLIPSIRFTRSLVTSVFAQEAYASGSRAAKAWADAEGGKIEIPKWADQPEAKVPLTPVEVATTSFNLKRLLTSNEGPTNSAAFDGYMQSQLNPLASKIIKTGLPDGLAVPFPANTFGLMVTTGAKGSTVNQSQVSCALGQQALEGRRVPRMSSGKTLPSFAPYDPSPRADGFITDRFLTGVRPQEYYFHCMAGREGLVDTAVKTSRSGYLQRCLVKHLEELKVCYDSTVRDGEGGIVQFLYGEDGIDPTKAAYLDCSPSTLQFLARNQISLQKRYAALPDSDMSLAADNARLATKLREESAPPLDKGSVIRARKLRVGSEWRRGALCRGWFDAVITKRHNDGIHFDIIYVKDEVKAMKVPLKITFSYCGGRITAAASRECTIIKAGLPDPILSSDRHHPGASGACVSERVAGEAATAVAKDQKLREAMNGSGISPADYCKLIAAKYSSALCAPGEAVGCIAAQSIGEPSTQMTLNTFHLAGSGANVTLGIPRLREIIMTASRALKTPTMSVPMLPAVSDQDATRIMRNFAKLTLKDVISSHEGITVNDTLEQTADGSWDRVYYISLKLHPAGRIKEAFGLRVEDIAKVVTRSFVPKMAMLMRSELKRAIADGDATSLEVSGGATSEFLKGDNDEDAQAKKSPASKGRKQSRNEDEYDDEETGEEDGVTGSRFSHRKEIASYGDMDDDEKAMAKEEEKDNDEIVQSYEEDDDLLIPTVTDGEGDGFRSTSNGLKINRRKNTLILQPLGVDPAARPLLMVAIVEKAAQATVVRCRPDIDDAFLNDEEGGRGRCLQTAGVNFEEIWKLTNVDHRRLHSNDIWAIRCAYGVEAARMTIVEQIRSVFAVYGISVDPRHLSLIADYMTYDGGYKAMNRIGMMSNTSAFLQMSFETTCKFLTEAAIGGYQENLASPSASIVVGRPIRHGTGAFECLTCIPQKI